VRRTAGTTGGGFGLVAHGVTSWLVVGWCGARCPAFTIE
jgi:hypothetical protein